MEEEVIDQPETDTEEKSEEGEAAVEDSKTEESVKDVLGKKLGKEFSSDEEALAAVEGLKNLVGDQKVAENRKKVKELETLKKDPQYAALSAQIQSMELAQKHPEANDYLDEVKAIADAKGISYSEAFETSKFGKLVAEQGKADKQKQDKIESIPKTDATVSNASEDDWADASKKANEGDMGALIRLKMPNVFKEQ